MVRLEPGRLHIRFHSGQVPVFFEVTHRNPVPALHVERPATSGEHAPVHEVNRQTSAVGSNVACTSAVTERCITDIKDEYKSDDFLTFDESRFTCDYFIYEQGQKDIIVRKRLKEHIQFWKDIGANQFILDSIEYGYKIPFYSLPGSAMLRNNKSAREHLSFVLEAITDLLDRGLIEQLYLHPKVVSPLPVSS